ncbi:ABC transporter substrate-binding protein [Streptomyces sp. 8N706]|uniref:ABC transporter substrate-binding protein n=1 Tax=Streptomyces sp. 8N706 TaxID=3457416 RepID=UPI003FD2C412
MIAYRAHAAALGGCLALASFPLSGCGVLTDEVAASKNAAVATSAKHAGGMDALVAAAKEEGRLNAVAIPRDWANYGALIDGFTKKYGIKVHVENPNGSSEDEIAAVKADKGEKHTPDILDVGGSFAQAAAEEGLLAPYRVAAYDKIPKTQKDPRARWYNDYGGYISIGCDATQVNSCPESFAQLLKPEYAGKVALNGNPVQSGSAFSGVYAAALANNGSFDDIGPGLEFFEKLKRTGNYNPVESTPETVEKGRTPISIDWDYLNAGYADQFRSKGMDWQVNVPTDGVFAQYYTQAINKDAPHPAAARLWQEYLFSPEGQNLRLDGYARPVLMDAMKEDRTLHEIAAAWLPEVEGTPRFPTEEQTVRAKKAVARGWADAVR